MALKRALNSPTRAVASGVHTNFPAPSRKTLRSNSPELSSESINKENSNGTKAAPRKARCNSQNEI